MRIIEAYARASGCRVPGVLYFFAFAYWKIAVIAEGAYPDGGWRR